MKFVIERSTLLRALSAVQGVVARKTTVPIVSHLLLTAKDGKLTIQATDLDREATVSAQANVITEGQTCAPADMLAKIANSAAEGAEISFDLGEGAGVRLTVKSGRSRFDVSVLPAADFPTFSTFKPDVEIETIAPTIANLIGRVAHAQSGDAGKWIMNGVYLTGQAGLLTSVATDTTRLALVEEAWEGDADFGVIIPTPMVNEMLRALNSAELATVRLNQSKIQIETVNGVVTSKLIVGPYVNFRRVIPTETPNLARVSRTALIAAVKRAAIAADDNHRSCKVHIDGSAIKVSARGQDAEAGDEVDCEYAGPALSPSVNSANMIEALEAVRGEAVVLSFTDRHDEPFLVSADGDDGLMQLIMPLRG